MAADIYLIAPETAEPEALRAQLDAALDATPVAALLLPRGSRSDSEYAAFVSALAPGVQARGCAVLVEGEPRLVRALNVDGVHVTGDVKAIKAAIAALKPHAIVGVSDVHTRHDAMTKGELDVDYILFGPLSGPISAEQRELARWWAETMQLPSVLSDPEASLGAFEAEGCEFIALNTDRVGGQS